MEEDEPISVKSAQIPKEESADQEERNEKLDEVIIEPDQKSEEKPDEKVEDFNLIDIVDNNPPEEVEPKVKSK